MPEVPFDPINALKEELQGISNVLATVHRQRDRAENRMSEAEVEFNDLRKLEAFIRESHAQKLAALRKLQDEKEKPDAE